MNYKEFEKMIIDFPVQSDIFFKGNGNYLCEIIKLEITESISTVNIIPRYTGPNTPDELTEEQVKAYKEKVLLEDFPLMKSITDKSRFANVMNIGIVIENKKEFILLNDYPIKGYCIGDDKIVPAVQKLEHMFKETIYKVHKAIVDKVISSKLPQLTEKQAEASKYIALRCFFEDIKELDIYDTCWISCEIWADEIVKKYLHIMLTSENDNWCNEAAQEMLKKYLPLESDFLFHIAEINKAQEELDRLIQDTEGLHYMRKAMADSVKGKKNVTVEFLTKHDNYYSFKIPSGVISRFRTDDYTEIPLYAISPESERDCVKALVENKNDRFYRTTLNISRIRTISFGKKKLYYNDNVKSGE